MARRNKNSIESFMGSSLIPFLDLAMLLGVLTLFLAIIQQPHINEPPKGEEMKQSDVSPTAIFVQVGWTFNNPHDVDTYFECDVHLAGRKVTSTVNFKQKNSTFTDLIVDDLGRPSPENYERVLSNSVLERLLPNTRCQLNVHLYNSHGGALPLQGVFHVILNKDHPDGEMQLTPVQGLPFELKFGGQEVTLMELVIDENAKVMLEATTFYPEADYRCQATCEK